MAISGGRLGKIPSTPDNKATDCPQLSLSSCLHATPDKHLRISGTLIYKLGHNHNLKHTPIDRGFRDTAIFRDATSERVKHI